MFKPIVFANIALRDTFWTGWAVAEGAESKESSAEMWEINVQRV